jgi:FKBP-type peptidyl-prolyl cis-trans isomerase
MRKQTLALIFLSMFTACSNCGKRAPKPRATAAVADKPAVPEGPAPPADLNAPPGEAQHLPSGLITRLLVKGNGARPAAHDLVRLNYVAWTLDGKVFDDTYKRGQPAQTPLDLAIAGWTEGVQLMQEGEKRRFWIPPELAYKGRPGLPQGPLVFDIELLNVDHRAQAETPPDLQKPPEKALKSKSGLVSLVLKKGTGKERPGPGDTVTVHYDGWKADGTLFDSTKKRGGAATFPLYRVIAGFREGITMMVVGEKRRLWIPDSLAYAGREGPTGPFVYDMELLSIDEKGVTPPPQPEKKAPPPPPNPWSEQP